MLLEGGIFVKTWTSKLTNLWEPALIWGSSRIITCSGLWKPLAGCAGRASTSDLEKPTCSKWFLVNQILGTTSQKVQFLPRVSGSQWNFLVSTWCSEERIVSSIMFGHFAGDRSPWNCGKFSPSVSSSFCRCKRPGTPEWRFHLEAADWNFAQGIETISC